MLCAWRLVLLLISANLCKYDQKTFVIQAVHNFIKNKVQSSHFLLFLVLATASFNGIGLYVG